MLKTNDSIRIRKLFDSNWRFYLGDVKSGELLELDDSKWRIINLPHDYSIEGRYEEKNISGIKGGFLPTGIAWYRKRFDVPKEWLYKKVFIQFDGIYMNSDVWINGIHLGHRPYGYIGFEYDITPHINDGANVLSVRVDNQKAPSGRWYTGSGIYRHSWLVVKARTYINHWGICITTPEVSKNTARVSVKAEVINECSNEKEITVVSKVVGENTCSSSNKIILSGEKREVNLDLIVENPKLWSPDCPNLYLVKTYIMEGDKVLDDTTNTFGIRYLEFNSSGFKLNGQPIKLKGVCEHHDAGLVGTAVPEKVLKRRLKLLKEMGCNAIRTAHTPMAPEFYDFCDKMGIMVMDEVFDGWETPKMPFDYGLYFDKWWQKDLKDFLKRDCNHPSVIIWSIGNEVKEMKKETTKKLVDFVHKHEPTRPVTCGVQQKKNWSDENRELLDIAGYNGGGGAAFVFEDDHKKHPDRVCVATEIPHTFQTRGFYRTQTWWRDKNQERIEIENLTEEEIFFDGALAYNSSYDNSGVRISARDSWKQTKALSYLIGEFRWTGFDYLGESFGWPARSGNFGILDLCGFKKDHYFLYQSLWTKEPMVHILPHWTHPDKEGVIIPVWVYTNCDSVELILNGQSLGEKKMTENLYIQWNVSYIPGELKAIGMKDGNSIVVKSVHTAYEATEINLIADNTDILADSRDVSHIRIEILDKYGNEVNTSNDKIFIKSFGPVNMLGMDNGDPLDLTPHKENCRRVFNGLALGIFQSTYDIGDIEILAGGILGEHLFEKESKVSIAHKCIMLRGNQKYNNFDIYYTLDGSEPTLSSIPYKKPFIINKTCNIKAAIYNGYDLVMLIEDEFRKGKKPFTVDLTHGNKNHDIANGPFAKEVIGIWKADGEEYIFELGGIVVYKIEGKEIRTGHWWYDYPADPFEMPEYAGMGEVVWEDGTTYKIDLRSQKCEFLNVRNICECKVFSRSICNLT